MYKETGKEKMIRFSIISAIAAVTLYLFVSQYTPTNEVVVVQPEKIQVKQLAVVLQEFNIQHHSPVLAMVKEHENQPMLIIYKVDIENNYRFETQYAVNLEDAPTDIKRDEVSDGVWLKTDNTWTYYDSQLRQAKRQEQHINKEEPTFSVNINEVDSERYELQIHNEDGTVLKKELDKEPITVVLLSEQKDLWFVLFEKDTILLVP
ncbi:hypothetical protein FZC76_09155 [Sutcliffiella horikoshii]|uniref:Uncharacterized protein n=1 Tax=Sutcliffiella horikoshii TaxID=79883 RepID=A0A5D4T0I7_9BACI|nr:hypothetical protein [Sutcliffiella horikoshii]TYS69083.1 hypothetical protein FZC76_09155 [Sutcliffiella horikoshii]